MARLSPWRPCEHWKIAVRKEETIQVSLSSWLSIKRSEKGDRVQFVLQHHKPDITARTQYKCLVGLGLQAWERIRAWDARQSRRWLLSPNSDARWCAFLCNLRHLNLSFLSINLLFIRYFYDVMAHWSLFCQKKNIRKTPLSPIRKHFQGNYAMTFLS